MALEISACVYQTTTSIQRLKNALSTVPSFHILLEPWKTQQISAFAYKNIILVYLLLAALLTVLSFSTLQGPRET